MTNRKPIEFFLPTTKGGPGSGNHGHSGLPGVHGGSSPTTKREGMQPASPEQLAYLQAQIKREGGFSYHPISNSSPKTGYMVSDNKPTVVVPIQKEYRPIMKAFILENINKFDEKDKYFGGWVDTEKSLVFFDVAKNIQSIEEASIRAINEDQLAIWDLSVFDEIRSLKYLDNIPKSKWTKELVKKTHAICERQENGAGEFLKKYKTVLSKMFEQDFLSKLKSTKERMKDMAEDKRHWTEKEPEEWTEEDKKQRTEYQQNRKPLRFQFGHDTTEEEVDDFLDTIFGPEKKDSKKKS